MKLIEREPTQEMLEAGENTFSPSYTGTPISSPDTVWYAMYDAAPEVVQDPVTECMEYAQKLCDAMSSVERIEARIELRRAINSAIKANAQEEIDKRDERIARLEEDKATLVRNCNQSIDAMQGQQETIAEQAKRIEELEFSWAGCSQQLKDACDDLNLAEEHARRQAAEITKLKALVGKCKDGIEGALSDDIPYINKCKEALAAIKEIPIFATCATGDRERVILSDTKPPSTKLSSRVAPRSA